MKRAQFLKPGSLLVEYQEHREGPTPVWVCWKPDTSQSFTDTKALLKFAGWPRSTPTGVELREWIEAQKCIVVEQSELDPTADTKVIT